MFRSILVVHDRRRMNRIYWFQVIGLTYPVARQIPKIIPVARTPRNIQTAFRSPNFSVSCRPLAVL